MLFIHCASKFCSALDFLKSGRSLCFFVPSCINLECLYNVEYSSHVKVTCHVRKIFAWKENLCVRETVYLQCRWFENMVVFLDKSDTFQN